MNNVPLRVHVLYESSANGVPHGCSEIRLLRPLSHPAIQSEVALSSGLALPHEQPDVVIIERLWDYSFDQAKHSAICAELARRKVPVIFEIDDDLLSLPVEPASDDGSICRRKIWLRWMLRFANGVIVSTPSLASRLMPLNNNIEIVPNALDERLFHGAKDFPEPALRKELVVGYMGTPTHLDDLFSIISPLRRVLARHQGNVFFEIVGVGHSTLLKDAFRNLPFRLIEVPAGTSPYQKFVPWMLENLRWDLGIAPLIDTLFSRSKSDIKFLDYAAQGIPGIFSDLPPYSKSIRHGENGVLASSNEKWEEELDNLIINANARVRMAINAHNEVWQNRMLETKAYNWLDAIRKIIFRTANHQVRAVPFKSFAAATMKSLDENRESLPRDLTRNEKVLYGFNLSGFGLEIGPSYCPVASKRAGFNVETLDHADADTLRKKYKRLNVDTSRIEEVDYVWAGEALNELTGKTEYYDWIIASHVIEHTPDLVAFLQQCEVMLKPGGILSLAIPDHRYCFDRFRAANTPGDIIQAYLEQRCKHTVGAVWDHFSMITRKGETVSWGAGHTGDFTLIHSIEEAREMFLKASSSDAYIDVHNWRFTPSSFRLILEDIGFLRLSGLVIRSVFPTVGCEFFVQLEKLDTNVRMSAVAATSRLKILQQALSESLVAT